MKIIQKAIVLSLQDQAGFSARWSPPKPESSTTKDIPIIALSKDEDDDTQKSHYLGPARTNKGRDMI